jgi:4-hydroxybenzoate polyprenyltransferase
MTSTLVTVLLVVGGLFALWAVAVAVYMFGRRMKEAAESEDNRDDRGEVFMYGIIYTLVLLLVLFLLVRFVKFAWTFG